MIYEGLRIKTPSKKFIKKYKTYDGDDVYTFLYGYGTKNKETNKYEVKERYTIYVKNIVPNEDSEIICTKIISCKPVIKTSSDGREFLQCEVTIEADNVKKPKLSRYKDNVDNGMKPEYVEKEEETQTYNNNNNNYDYVDEDELPF